MKKIEGLKFLNDNFYDYSINSTFIENDSDLRLIYEKYKDVDCLFRVRGCNKYGSELNLPMATFTKIEDVINYIINEKKRNNLLDFVVHSVDNSYFNPVYIGTIAVYNSYDKPSIKIEIQKVTKELVAKMNILRPRDWPVSLSLEYDFLSKVPIIHNFQNIKIDEIRDAIYQLFKIGKGIYNIYDENKIEIDTYTRFNIYENNSIILDDHRSVDSFIFQKRK